MTWEVTPSQGLNMLQTTPVMNRSVGPVAHRELNIHPTPTTDEQLIEGHVGDLKNNIIEDEGLFCQIIKQEDMKPENASSEDEELDYSIQSTKAQASDNSCVGDGCQNSDISKSNYSISSVDAKTVKIELHRMDLSTAAVTEHLNPTDLEYTSQCNTSNYSENVEMMRPNICEEYKQTVHTSSELHCSENSDSFKHIRTHTGDTIYKCRICEKRFSKQSVLNADFRCTHKKPHMCYKCGRSFTYKCDLFIHIRSHTGEKPFRCHTCDKGFYRSSHLTTHIRSHTGEKPFRCPTCDKCFKQSSDLTTHIRSHTGEKPFRCPRCDKGFKQSGDLTRHIRSHTGEKPFRCPTCDKGFSQSSFLTTHIRSHTGEKPFRCPLCDKGFNYNSSLTKHIRTHTGEKPFRCPTCDKGYNQSSHLTSHIRTHTGEKPYKCDTCAEGFITKAKLSNHILVHTLAKDQTNVVKPHK